MTDRHVQFPNRFEIVPVPGTTNIFDVLPAPGTVYAEGTFWNKQNVLKDATAALYGKGSNASPDDIFAAIRPLITAAQNTAELKGRIVSGNYVGTGKYGASNPNMLSFPFVPKIVAIVLNVYISGGNIGSIEYMYQQNYYIWMLHTDIMETTYKLKAGFGSVYSGNALYGKKSSDGKSIYWYSGNTGSNADAFQFNEPSKKYYWFAIG